MTVLSCGKARQKMHVVTNGSEDAMKAQTDRVFPTYNTDTADTKDNQNRFREHLQIELTNDVKDLYTYGDFMAIDYSVLMSFSCDQSTIDRIIEQNGLQLSNENNMRAISFPGKFRWWKQDEIDQLIPYRAGEEDEFWQYLWYNPVTRQAFYEEFSM